MAQVIELDREAFRLSNENLWLETETVSPGAGLDGREQLVFSENRRWIGQLDFVPTEAEGIMPSFVMGDRLRGRANILRVPLCNPWTLTFKGDLARFYRDLGLPEEIAERGSIPYSDGANFSDGAGFALPGSEEPTVHRTVRAGASEITLRGLIGANLSVGAYFSIDDFAYRVESNDDGRVRFNPPLRQDVQSGQTVNVSQPYIRVRLRSDDGWRPFSRHHAYGEAMSVEVVEAFER